MYQLDIFDFLNDEYIPVESPSEHSPCILWFCKKCGKPVGSVADGRVLGKKAMCSNGHKQNWEETSIRFFEAESKA